MNSLKFINLKEIIKVISYENINDETTFDYFRIVKIDKFENNLYNNELFFFTYSHEEDIKNGWINKMFDYRKYINNITKERKNSTFVIEENMIDDFKNKNLKYIVVKNMHESIDLLYKYFLNKSKPLIIGVTGTVGKTGTVGLIEHTLKEKYNVLRIYSKRITPYILKSYIINTLTTDVEVITLEMSIYYKNHVKILCELLHPDISCILNISTDHLQEGNFNGIEDICKHKAEILKYARVVILNKSDKELKKLKIKNNKVYYNKEYLMNTSTKKIIKITSSPLIIQNKKIKPYILTDLSNIEYKIAYKISKLLKLTNKEIIERFKTFIPPENRIQNHLAFNKEIIFDGDITGYERLECLTKNHYKKTNLVLRKVGSSEEIGKIINIGELFKSFNKVIIFKDVEYLNFYKNYPNVTIVDNHDFMEYLEGTIIYHYSGYFRVWDEYNEENLKTYDNEKYKVKNIW